MPPGNLSLPLQAVLEDQLETSRALREILTMEQRAIADRDYDALNQCGEDKQTQLMRLESLEVERRQFFEAMNVDVKSDPEDAVLADLWHSVLDMLAGCQKANEVNGAMVRTQSTQIQRALDLLAGREGPNAVYEANGMATTGSSPRTIAKA